MKGLLRMFTQKDRCTPLAGASGRHVQKFGHFREFLVGNRNALRALARAGDALLQRAILQRRRYRLSV